MAEAGGPTTQSGILYQNSIAALYLASLLDLRPLPGSASRATAVRVEAPEHVDDIVVTYADGEKLYIQAKEELSTSGEVWKTLWMSVQEQVASFPNGASRISIVLGSSNGPFSDLREAFARAKGKLNDGEWRSALNVKHLKLAASIEQALQPGKPCLFELATSTDIVLWSLEHIETMLVRDWMPPSTVLSVTLFQLLRDNCAGGARIRKNFTARDLAEKLLSEHGIRLVGSQGDMIEKYRRAIATEYSHVSVPGTMLSASEAALLVFPHVRASNTSHRSDFDDEDFRGYVRREGISIDLRLFPYDELQTIILESGAGHGKTTLLRATARRLAADTSLVPAMIGAGTLQGRQSLIDHLETVTGPTYDVEIDWRALAETGRLVLLIDGIDEIGDVERTDALAVIGRAAARYPTASIMVAARDAAIAALPPTFARYRVESLDEIQQSQMLTAYLNERPELDARSVLEHVRGYSDLSHLCSIPLFLAMFVATLQPKGPYPTSRSELLEHYLEIILSPHKHKRAAKLSVDVERLRCCAEALALLGLDRNENAVPLSTARQTLAAIGRDSVETSLNALIRVGLLQRRGVRIAFTIPTVQEYLAGSALAQNGRLDAADWMQSIYRRPWAQALQFAIEQTPAAGALLEKILTGTDDIYHTCLRFVARCIVNGAHVRPDFKAAVADRLVVALERSDWSTAVKVGQLIKDGFSRPPSEALRSHLRAEGREIERAGILCKAAEPELTRQCFEAVLRLEDLRELWSCDWLNLVREMPAYAVPKLLARAKAEGEGSLNSSVIAEVLYSLKSESMIDWPAIVKDRALPAVIRLAAQFGSTWTEGVDFELMDSAADEQSHHLLWHNFTTSLMSVPNWRTHIRDLSQSGNENAHNRFATYLHREISEETIQREIIELLIEIATDSRTARPIRLELCQSLTACGYKEFARVAVDNLRDATPREALYWAYTIPFFEEIEVENGIAILRNLDFSTSDQLQLLSALAMEMEHSPIETAKSIGLGGRSFRRRDKLPTYAGTLATWAGTLRNKITSLKARAELAAVDFKCNGGGDVSGVADVLTTYLDLNEEIADQDWPWIAGLLRCFEISDKPVNLDLLWRTIEQSAVLPMYSVMRKIIIQLGPEGYPHLIRYWREGKSRSAKSEIISYFEVNAPRLGLRVDIVDKELVIRPA